MKRIVYTYTFLISALIASFSLSAENQGMDLVSKYIATRTNPNPNPNPNPNAKEKKQQERISDLWYLNNILSPLETKQEALAVHALDEHLMKKIDYLCENSKYITAFGLYRALRMLEEPMTEKIFQSLQNNRFDRIKTAISHYKNLMDKNWNHDLVVNPEVATRIASENCIKKIVTLCDNECKPVFNEYKPSLGSRFRNLIPTYSSVAMIYGCCTSLYNTIATPWWNILIPMLYNGYMGAHAAKSILKSLEKSINPKPRFKEQVKSNIAEEREKFLEKIEKAIDSCTDINTTTNADLQTRVKEKLQSLSLQDFEDALAELIENKQATFVTLEKKPYENDIKSGLEKVFTETKNQTITLSPNDKGNGFGQNFLIMKKSKTQTQDSMYDVATNIVCAHAFNMFFGVNMNKDTITMPFIDVYHLIVGIKTYSTEKDFTFLEEIYIPKKTIIKKTLSS